MPPTPDQQNPPAASPDPQQQAAAATSGSAPSQATPIDQGSAAAVPAAAPTTAPASAAASVQAPANAQQQQPGIKHVLGDIFQTLAGGQKIVYTQGPNGPVKTYQDLKPGEMARGILAAAITGLASGYDPANRGKGPAMSAAFANGFKGEDEMRTGLADRNEKEAQQQFVNNNLAEEMKMKKAKFAQDQVQSVIDYQKSQLELSNLATKAKQEGIVFDENQKALFRKMDDDYYTAVHTGHLLDDPKNPGHPLTFHDDAQAYKHMSDLGIALTKPGDYDTKVVRVPGGLGYQIAEVSIPDQEKQAVRFAKMDPKHPDTPLRDKDNKLIWDGTSVDLSGHPLKPGTYNGATYGPLAADSIAYKKSVADAARVSAEAAKDREEIANNKSLREASNRLADAGNNPYAVNTKTGQWSLFDGDRKQLQAFWASQVDKLETAIHKGQDELGQLDPKTQAAQYKDKQAQIDQDQRDWTSAKSKLADTVEQSVTKGKGLADSLLRENKNDPKKAGEYFEKQVKSGAYGVNLKPEDIAETRSILQSAINTSNQNDVAREKQEAAAKQNASIPLNTIQQSIVDSLKDQPINVVTGNLDLYKVDPQLRPAIYLRLGLTPPAGTAQTPPAPVKPAPAGAPEIKNLGGAISHFAQHPSEAPPVPIIP